MANPKLNESFTEFSSSEPGRTTTWLYPISQGAKFFAKFISSPGARWLDLLNKRNDTQDKSLPPPPQPTPPLAGDTIVRPDITKFVTVGEVSRNTLPLFPQQELERKRRYKEYESMDDYPEIGSAFDIYADDCTQQNLNGAKWEIITDDEVIKDEVENLFEVIGLEKYIWDIVRNTVKYGDCFIELVVDLNNIKKGIQRIKILNPFFMYRMEDEFGYLTGYLQEIPIKDDWTTGGGMGPNIKDNSVIPLDKAQIVHFRLHTSDPAHYPYGKSIAAAARSIYRNLKMMEDAMLIYRLSRAPERRIFYIDTGSLPASKAEQHLNKQMEKFSKNKLYNATTGSVEANFTPIAADEDYYLAVNGKTSGTRIETLPGADNLGEVDDVKYFRDKLLAVLKVPKDFITEKDQSPERKANLSQLDVKFARVIGRIQRSIEIGLEAIAHRHLMIKEFPYNRIVKTNVKLPEPSDMAVKRQLDLDEQKARCVQAVKGIGIFPIEKIYKDYYRLTDAEIGKIKEQLKKEQKDPIFGPMTMAGMGGPGGPPMGAPGMDAMGDQQGYNDAGNQESAENEPPTQDNSKSQSKREEITYDDTIELLKESGGSLEAIKVLMELKSSNKINS